MVENTLPGSPADLATVSWEEIQPNYEELATRPLDDLERWLADWSSLEGLLDEAAALAGIAYAGDTRDLGKEAAHLHWTTEINPLQSEQGDRLARRLLDSGRSLPGLDTALRRFRNQVELFRSENLALEAELSKLSASYQKVVGSMTVEWDGARLTIPQVAAKLGEPDRAVRERAFRLSFEPFVEQRPQLVSLFDAMYALRGQAASNAGFASYRDYVHRAKNRFDYTPDDCLRWANAVEEAIVPAARRALERRRRKMGLQTLRPWDVQADPLGRPQLRPFERTAELCTRAAGIFSALDPALASHFQVMLAERLLDLESRPGKAPGGFCMTLSHSKRAFVFMNAVGVDGDVRTLLHESGHAFHGFEKLATQPLIWQQMIGSELAEFASMSMELLALPFLSRAAGGFYSEPDERRARASYLESVLLLFGHIASVDAFQQWAYTDSQGALAEARDAKWLELRARFEPGVDWSGLDRYRIARWYAQLHLFEFPFYYIEYGLARLAALQVWRNSRRDPAGAVGGYRRALALGSSRSLPEVYAAAGASLVFDAREMRELIELVEEELEAAED